MLAWCIATAVAVVPTVGIEVRPIPRTPPETVSQALEAAVVPPLVGYGGVRVWRLTVLASLGVAQRRTVARADGIQSVQRVGLVRPALDVRFALLDRPDGVPEPYLLVGGQITVPVVSDVSDGYTDDEQEAADLAAAEERRRLGRFGGRVGAGAVMPVWQGLGLGGQVALDWSRSYALGDQPGTVTGLLSTDVSVLLQFEW